MLASDHGVEPTFSNFAALVEQMGPVGNFKYVRSIIAYALFANTLFRPRIFGLPNATALLVPNVQATLRIIRKVEDVKSLALYESTTLKHLSNRVEGNFIMTHVRETSHVGAMPIGSLERHLLAEEINVGPLLDQNWP